MAALQRLTLATVAALVLLVPERLVAQGRGNQTGELPTIEAKTEGFRKIDGFLPLYWDDDAGKLWMEIARFDTDLLHLSGLGAGLGSNDIGLDRGRLQGSRVVRFQRVGRKVLMVQPNFGFRASSDNAAEVRAVEDAFARSVLWGFTVAARTGDRVLVDVTDFLLHDFDDVGSRMRPGTYRVEASRSAVYLPMTMGFPKNTEMEAQLTFTRRPGGSGGGTSRFFEGVGDVSPTSRAATIRVHHSFVELPDTAGYTPRAYDPRAGYFPRGYRDYAVPLGESMDVRFITRHRLHKVDPAAPVSDAVEPIVYYLDPGTPEPVRSALLDGARWWNEAFEAAGYRNAFRVEILPDSVSPLDIRYNVINWVHRSTRGWSYGASVVDPRTGEIIKGVVTLGSLRIRQDYMIAEGLLAPYENGDERPPELAEWALARIRQLSAHEVGHTLGLAHNYYDSRVGRISVMDYPHPLVRLARDGSFDYSEVYDTGIGEWDKVAIVYGYQDFPDGTDERVALEEILNRAWDQDLRFLTNQDISTHPKADQWSNGTNVATELNRMMEVRRVALRRFGERAIQRGMPLATMEEVLVPLYMHHRYQVTAAASALGGVDYIYALRGDGRDPVRPADRELQEAALNALLGTLDLSELALPETILRGLPPRPMGYGRHRELFPRYTGTMFDVITPAVVAASHTIGEILEPTRAARLVEQHALDPSLPGLDEVLDALFETVFGADPRNAYEEEIQRAVERVLVERLMALTERASMPQVRAAASWRLETTLADIAEMDEPDDPAVAAHVAMLARDIGRFLARPGAEYRQAPVPNAPPGAPIGDPAMRWLERLEPACSWEAGQSN